MTRFTLPGGTDAVMVNDGEVCGGERIKGANCSTGGCAVAGYARVRGAWRNVLAGRNDPFVSADWTREPPALRMRGRGVVPGDVGADRPGDEKLRDWIGDRHRNYGDRDTVAITSAPRLPRVHAVMA